MTASKTVNCDRAKYIKLIVKVHMWKTAIECMPQTFPANTIKLGKHLQLHGHVLHQKFSDGLVKARVKGDANQIFNVFLDLKTWPEVPARCGCRTARNCEHAAAALLALGMSQSQPEDQETSMALGGILDDETVLEPDEFEWYSEVSELKNDFFSYELGILIDGQRVSIVPAVIELFERWDVKSLKTLSDALVVKLPLVDNKILKISLGRIKPLLHYLLQYARKKNPAKKSLHMAQYQLLLMLESEQAIAASRARWHGTETLQKKLQQLTTLQDLPEVKPPEGLKIQLRDYQQTGLNWLQALRSLQFSGILADDMGLGKTVQALAHLQYEKEQGRLTTPTLIIAPTSLVGNWFAEARRFTPNLKVLIFHGSTRHEDTFHDYDIVVSTYGLLQRDKKKFLAFDFYYLILDEAQFIKNARTKTTQLVQQIKAKHRLCLTGTPLENHLGELWSLFHFLMPGFLGTAAQFRQRFKKPIEKEHDIEKQRLLKNMAQPFMLRRTKSEVIQELPDKTEIIRTFELSDGQRDLYESIRMSMEKKVRQAIAEQGLGKSHIILLDALLRLRQVCCDPRLISDSAAEMAKGRSVKLEALMALLENTISEGRTVLVFSQFTSMLKLIEIELEACGYPYLKLTGATQNRSAVVEQFQSGKAPIFLISLKAGGVGLNLTQADTVIHYDPWWNPAVEDQATDRSYRIGQENPVFVYKLIAEGTVEAAILKMQDKKRALIEGVLSSTGSGQLQLNEEDIAEFFKPL